MAQKRVSFSSLRLFSDFHIFYPTLQKQIVSAQDSRRSSIGNQAEIPEPIIKAIKVHDGNISLATRMMALVIFLLLSGFGSVIWGKLLVSVKCPDDEVLREMIASRYGEDTNVQCSEQNLKIPPGKSMKKKT